MMECFYGVFWFCSEAPSCELICHDEDCYMFTREVCRNSGSNHPICPTHQRWAKLPIVKDKMKDNYERPFFVCSDLHDLCNFWQWGDVCPRARCKHGMVCSERKVKKDGSSKGRFFTPVLTKMVVGWMRWNSCDHDWLCPVQ